MRDALESIDVASADDSTENFFGDLGVAEWSLVVNQVAGGIADDAVAVAVVDQCDASCGRIEAIQEVICVGFAVAG